MRYKCIIRVDDEKLRFKYGYFGIYYDTSTRKVVVGGATTIKFYMLEMLSRLVDDLGEVRWTYSGRRVRGVARITLGRWKDIDLEGQYGLVERFGRLMG